jgi:GT2 family glycosyltransferase
MQHQLQKALPFISPIVLMEPERVIGSPAWLGHTPFAYWIVEALQPRLLVDYCTLNGNSLSSFVQAVKVCGLSTYCFGVGKWNIDKQGSPQVNDAFQDLNLYLETRYPGLYTLVRGSIDDPSIEFADGSIDLLSIHGLPTYDEVRLSFELWLPKISDRGLVLFQDTNVRYGNIGVWRLWEELCKVYPSFEFPHSQGLGVLVIGRNIPEAIQALLDATRTDMELTAAVRDLFARLGAYVICNRARIDISIALQLSRQEIHQITDESVCLRNKLKDHHNALLALLSEVERLRNSIKAEGEQLRTALAASEKERKQLQETNAAIVSSTSWWITTPLRLIKGLTGEDNKAVISEENFAKMKVSIKEFDVLEKECQTDPRDIFDEKWYHGIYPDTNDWDDLYRHYVELGAAEGRDPSPLFSTNWYLEKYPEVGLAKLNPLIHFAENGARDRRSPHRLFDSNWYLSTYDDVGKSGQNPLLHYIRFGAAELRNPNPNFDARYYVSEHPEAGENPLRHFILIGEAASFPTRKHCDIKEYLPYKASPIVPPDDSIVDIIIPVYRGLSETQACLASVLADTQRPSGHILVIDDCSPEPNLSEWLQELAAKGDIVLFRNPVNLGFVGTVNRGMTEAGRNDVVLLNSDTEVPKGWLLRLMAHAYMKARIASVTPFSNNATICSYPSLHGGTLPIGYTYESIDKACQIANGSRTVMIPSAVGFCMYIRRDCLDEVGLFDEEAFGRGYGEENDFCMRATELGWHHILACNIFVYHAGEISFGTGSSERANSSSILRHRHPSFHLIVDHYIKRDPGGPYRFATTVALFAASLRTNLLFFTNNLSGEVACHVNRLISTLGEEANVLLLMPGAQGIELTVPAFPDHPILELGWDFAPLVQVLQAFNLNRIHIHNWLGLGAAFVRDVVNALGLPFDITVYDCYAICPRIDYKSKSNLLKCEDPDIDTCKCSNKTSPGCTTYDFIEWRANNAWLFEEATHVYYCNDGIRSRINRCLDANEVKL